jgi:XTP/dITP diphosphohydrolase
VIATVHSPAPILLVATTNPGKLREFAELLDGVPVAVQSLAELPSAPLLAEDGTTYLDNARMKAMTIARWSGRVTLADDSGLEVDALAGAPGVHSARYAGPTQDSRANLEKVLQALAGIPEGLRTARFRCVIVVARPDGCALVAEGCCAGVITDSPRGDGGFGYDPVFLYPPAGRTFAELPATIKNQVSHRGRAGAQLRERLASFMMAAVARP